MSSTDEILEMMMAQATDVGEMQEQDVTSAGTDVRMADIAVMKHETICLKSWKA